MIVKLIGAISIMVACGGYGFYVAHRHTNQLRLLKRFLHILNRMEWELQYRRKPLPELCRHIVLEERDVFRELFLRLAIELENQIQPDVRHCMFSAIEVVSHLPNIIKTLLGELGDELGRYDLKCQVEGIGCVRKSVLEYIKEFETDKDKRVRGYKTLGLCAGAALVILFI